MVILLLILMFYSFPSFSMDETNQRESLRYDGVLVPAKIININTPSHSYLIESYRQIGERVKKNELIARWASPELLNQH